MTRIISLGRRLQAKLRRFAAIGPKRRRLILEAIFWLTAARVILSIIPFRYIAAHLGKAVPPDAGAAIESAIDLKPEQIELAHEIGWAVMCAARHRPFKAVCLPQAMAAKQMLRCRSIPAALYFGAARNTAGNLDIHTWLLAANVQVTGYPVAHRFVPFSCFI